MSDTTTNFSSLKSIHKTQVLFSLLVLAFLFIPDKKDYERAINSLKQTQGINIWADGSLMLVDKQLDLAELSRFLCFQVNQRHLNDGSFTGSSQDEEKLLEIERITEAKRAVIVDFTAKLRGNIVPVWKGVANPEKVTTDSLLDVKRDMTGKAELTVADFYQINTWDNPEFQIPVLSTTNPSAAENLEKFSIWLSGIEDGQKVSVSCYENGTDMTLVLDDFNKPLLCNTQPVSLKKLELGIDRTEYDRSLKPFWNDVSQLTPEDAIKFIEVERDLRSYEFQLLGIKLNREPFVVFAMFALFLLSFIQLNSSYYCKKPAWWWIFDAWIDGISKNWVSWLRPLNNVNPSNLLTTFILPTIAYLCLLFMEFRSTSHMLVTEIFIGYFGALAVILMNAWSYVEIKWLRMLFFEPNKS